MNKLGFALFFFTSALSSPAFASCTMSVGAVNFGTIDPLTNSDTDITSSIVANCAVGDTYTISIGGGHGTVSQRQMMDAANDVLTYNLYQDPARTIVWGDGTEGSTVSGTGSGSDATYVVYGRVPADPLAAVGTYADNVVVTLIIN